MTGATYPHREHVPDFRIGGVIFQAWWMSPSQMAWISPCRTFVAYRSGYAQVPHPETPGQTVSAPRYTAAINRKIVARECLSLKHAMGVCVARSLDRRAAA